MTRGANRKIHLAWWGSWVRRKNFEMIMNCMQQTQLFSKPE
jgi:hypothetical protein